jgi:trans-aconitate methyltransferase
VSFVSGVEMERKSCFSYNWIFRFTFALSYDELMGGSLMNSQNRFLLYCAIFFFFNGSFLAALDQYPTAEKAAFYNHHSQQQGSVAYEALKKMEFQGTEQVLDIGCGSGKITANISGRVGKGSVVGLDLSEGMVAFAQKTYQPFYPNLSFVRGNIQTFNFASKFDLIFSSSSLHWILDHEALLAQIHDLLRDEGLILFTIPCTPSTEIAAVFSDVISQEPWQTYLKDYYHPRRKFTSEEYILLLKQAAFKEVEVTQVPLTYYFETKREFANWFAAFSPMLLYIPEELHESFLISVAERYLRTFPLDKEGRVIFKQNELIIKAQKQSN